MQVELAESPQIFVLKDKLGTVKLGPSVSIGDVVLAGAGEYEISGIMAEATDHVVVCHLSDLNIAWVMKLETKLSLKELESIGTTHVLFARLANDREGVKALANVLSELEVPLAVLTGTEAELAELKKAGITCREESDPLKVAASDLLSDRNDVVVLMRSGE